MKRSVFAAIVIISVLVLVAGLVSAATAQDLAYAHQSMYDTSDTDTNATKEVSSHALETDGRSLVTAGFLLLIIVCIVAVALYRTREIK